MPSKRGGQFVHDPDAIDVDALAEAVADRLASRLAERLAAAASPAAHFRVKEAAEYSGLSEDSIRSLLTSGKLTALRPVPGRVVIDRRELDALLRASTKRPRRMRGMYDRGAGHDKAAEGPG